MLIKRISCQLVWFSFRHFFFEFFVLFCFVFSFGCKSQWRESFLNTTTTTSSLVSCTFETMVCCDGLDLWGLSVAGSTATAGPTVWPVGLRREEGVPVTNLFTGRFPHFLPMFRLLFDGTVEPQRDPSDQFTTFQTAFVNDGDEQSDFGQLEESHLEGERFQPGGSVGTFLG